MCKGGDAMRWVRREEVCSRKEREEEGVHHACLYHDDRGPDLNTGILMTTKERQQGCSATLQMQCS